MIAGQRSAGVELLHSSNTGISIAGNFIGTNSAVTKALGNGQLGVEIRYGKGNSISRNYISANKLGGISLEQGASGNWVEGNVIGMNGRQWKPLGTQNVGISIAGGSNSNLVRGNAIGGHQQHGIIVADTAGTLSRPTGSDAARPASRSATAASACASCARATTPCRAPRGASTCMGNVGGAAGNTVK